MALTPSLWKTDATALFELGTTRMLDAKQFELAIAAAIQFGSLTLTNYSTFEADGPVELVYVKNADTVAIPAEGELVVTKYGSSTSPFNVYSNTTAAPSASVLNSRAIGFSICSIPAGEHGWVVKRGVCLARSTNTTAINDGDTLVGAVATDTYDGGVKASTATDARIIAIAMVAFTATTAGDPFKVRAVCL